MVDSTASIKRELVIAVVGPTCTGKTRIGIELAKLVKGEIVSADSRQIYKLIDIGTAKPTPAELAEIPHHLVDMVPLDEDVSAGTYGILAREAIEGIFSREKVPILVGGSGLYVRSAIDGLFDAPEIDEKTRQRLRRRLESEGAEKLLDELRRVDPDAAKGLVPGNYKRILRCLEVYYSTGNRISKLRVERTLTPAFKTLQFGIAVERKEMYRRIEKRVDDMLAAGFLDEVKELLKRGFDPKLNSLQTVGYKEAIQYVQQKITFGDMLEQFKMNTRRYAKRQMTWFRKDSRIIWISADGKSPAEVAKEISGVFAGNG